MREQITTLQHGKIHASDKIAVGRAAAMRAMRRTLARTAMLVAALLLAAHSARAHGIAGNRYFEGTLTFDDPAVADEAILPLYQNLASPAQGSNVDENRINWAFARLLTPTLAFVADGGWLHQNWPVGHTAGPDKTDIGLKYEAYRNNRHEALISVGLMWGIAHSGARAVGMDAPNTIQPGLFVGKGFGDLPEALSWLRPFAITGAFVDEVPLGSGGMALPQIPRSEGSIQCLRRRSKPCIGVFRSSSARSISPAVSMAVRRRMSR
jgi:hypothetical protein